MISFGNHYRAIAHPEERQTLRDFYTGVFECEIQSSDNITANIPDNIDLFFFDNGHCFGVEYVPAETRILTQTEHYLASWMEIITDDVPALKAKCLAHGAVEITDFWDQEHFYFHAPGGQVYRLVAAQDA